jgi:hypothetical protein
MMMTSGRSSPAVARIRSEADVGVCVAGAGNERVEPAAGVLHRHATTKGEFVGRAAGDVQPGDDRLMIAGKVGGEGHHTRGAGREIGGTEDIANVNTVLLTTKELGAGGEHGAGGGAEDLLGNRAKEELAEAAASMSAEHDQVDLVLSDGSLDLGGDLAFADRHVPGNAGKLAPLIEVHHLALGLGAGNYGVLAGEHGSGGGVRLRLDGQVIGGHEHVQEMQPGEVMAGNRTRERHS